MARANNKRKGKSSKVAKAAASTEAKLKRVGDKQYDLSRYEPVKSADGNSSLDCGDELAKKLRGAELDEVYKQASKLLQEPVKALRSRYQHLNPGMQRMNLGNRMRAAMA